MLRRVLCSAVLAALALSVYGTAYGEWVWTPQTRRWINAKHLPKETAELQVEYARTLLLEGKYDKAMEETDKFDKFYGDTNLADQNQYVRGEILMARGKLPDAAQEFQKVVTAYPESDFYDDVIAKQYAIGDAQYSLGEKKLPKSWRPAKYKSFKQAIDTYNMVISNQPFKREAAEAQYKVGLCYYKRKEYLSAAYEYQRVMEDYSTSDWVDEASCGKALCYYEAALPSSYDQTPSQLTINSIEVFVERYPSNEAVADLQDKGREMRERIAKQRLATARFYEKRRSFKSAKIGYEVVVEQYAGTEAGEKARAWLADYEASGSRAQ